MVAQRGNYNYANRVAADDTFALSELTKWLPRQITSVQRLVINSQEKIDAETVRIASLQATITLLQGKAIEPEAKQPIKTESDLLQDMIDRAFWNKC